MIDDFLFIAIDQQKCAEHLAIFQILCRDIGIPLAPNKTTQPHTTTVFLGILLDSMKRIAQLPLDKIVDYTQCIQQFISQRKITRKELESLIGKLSFAAMVVPARAFLRRLIDRLSLAKKPYHYIHITDEMLADLAIWREFLKCNNGITYFRALEISDSREIHMASDASKLGFGACYGKNWIQCTYPSTW